MNSIAIDKLDKAVFDAMEDSFEGLGFFELTPTEIVEDTSDRQLTDNYIWSKILIKKPLIGSCIVILPISVAETISESILTSMEEPITEQTVIDTVGETANTVAGRLVCSLTPENNDVSLGLPETHKGWPELKSARLYKYATDDELLIYAAVEL